MNKLPVYLVLTSYFPTPTSWRCAFIYDQVKAIQRLNKYRVVVVNTNVDYDYEYNGVNVIGFKVDRKLMLFFPDIVERKNYKRFRLVLEKLGIFVREIAVIHSHLIPLAFLAARIKNDNPVSIAMVQFHDADPYKTIVSSKGNWLGIKTILYYRYHRRLAEQMDVCVSISENVARVARESPNHGVYLSYLPARKAAHDLRHCRRPRLKQSFVLHNGVDFEIFNSKSKDKRRSEEFVIGCIGNFIELKDHITLLRAISKIKDKIGNWKLRVIGSGPTLQACEKYVSSEKIQDNVTFLREVGHSQLPEFYRSLDLFVLPSYFEGFGCVFAEAAACGVPFITCRGQGAEDLLSESDRKLWLCNERDSSDLARAIMEFFVKRRHQRLCCEINIDKLIPAFLKRVEEIHKDVAR